MTIDGKIVFITSSAPFEKIKLSNPYSSPLSSMQKTHPTQKHLKLRTLDLYQLGKTRRMSFYSAGRKAASVLQRSSCIRQLGLFVYGGQPTLKLVATSLPIRRAQILSSRHGVLYGQHLKCMNLGPSFRFDDKSLVNPPEMVRYIHDTTKKNRIDVYTDASPKHGFGCVWAQDQRWATGRWNEKCRKAHGKNTDFYEAYAILAALEVWKQDWVGRQVFVHCDCRTVVRVFNKECKTKAQVVKKLVEDIKSLARRYNIDIKLVHLSREDKSCRWHEAADGLSRGCLEKFRMFLPDAKAMATALPSHLEMIEDTFLETRVAQFTIHQPLNTQIHPASEMHEV